jgi:hypothetical protein
VTVDAKTLAIEVVGVSIVAGVLFVLAGDRSR